MDVAAARMIGAGLAIVALLGVGIGLGNLFSNLIKSTARNPEVKDELFKLGLLGIAFTESIALFAFIVAILILYF